MFLANLSKLLAREAIGEPNKRRPKPSMNQRDLAADEPAHENLVGVGDRPKNRVDVTALRMRPPAALDGFADDSFRKPRRSPFGRREDDTMLSDESQRPLDRRALGHDAQ